MPTSGLQRRASSLLQRAKSRARHRWWSWHLSGLRNEIQTPASYSAADVSGILQRWLPSLVVRGGFLRFLSFFRRRTHEDNAGKTAAMEWQYHRGSWPCRKWLDADYSKARRARIPASTLMFQHLRCVAKTLRPGRSCNHALHCIDDGPLLVCIYTYLWYTPIDSCKYIVIDACILFASIAISHSALFSSMHNALSVDGWFSVHMHTYLLPTTHLNRQLNPRIVNNPA